MTDPGTLSTGGTRIFKDHVELFCPASTLHTENQSRKLEYRNSRRLGIGAKIWLHSEYSMKLTKRTKARLQKKKKKKNLGQTRVFNFVLYFFVFFDHFPASVAVHLS